MQSKSLERKSKIKLLNAIRNGEPIDKVLPVYNVLFWDDKDGLNFYCTDSKRWFKNDCLDSHKQDLIRQHPLEKVFFEHMTYLEYLEIENQLEAEC